MQRSDAEIRCREKKRAPLSQGAFFVCNDYFFSGSWPQFISE